MNNFTEKRKYKKVELVKRKYKEIVAPCIARFLVKQLYGREMPPLDWNIVAVKNLSAGGIKFNYYKENLEISSLIDLKIEFIKSIPTISCIGRVVRIEEAHANSMISMGIEFTEIDDKEREIINATVEEILRKETQRSVYSEKLLKMKNPLMRILGRAEAALKQESIPKEKIDTLLEESKETQKQLMPFEELACTRSPDKEIKEALTKDLYEVSARTQQKELIASLKDVIQEKTVKVEGLVNTVDSLKKHVTHLENKQEELTNKISNLKSELNFKEKEVSRKELEIKSLHHEINTIFYVIGNSKELRRKKIIDKEGIPLLRSLNSFSKNYVLGSDFTLAEFKQEEATLTKFRIEGRIKKLLPYLNKNHYDISYENGLLFINIKDSNNFWHQKYLVVVTN